MNIHLVWIGLIALLICILKAGPQRDFTPIKGPETAYYLLELWINVTVHTEPPQTWLVVNRCNPYEYIGFARSGVYEGFRPLWPSKDSLSPAQAWDKCDRNLIRCVSAPHSRDMVFAIYRWMDTRTNCWTHAKIHTWTYAWGRLHSPSHDNLFSTQRNPGAIKCRCDNLFECLTNTGRTCSRM